MRLQVFNAAAYNTTRFAKQGDLGTKVLPVRPTGTVWRRGGTERVRWQLTADHGGGYRYRLCPATEPLTEACFQAHPALEFATPAFHTLRFANSSRDRVIPAMVVTEGGGLGWMRNPRPPTWHTCDYVTSATWDPVHGEHCQWKCPGCGPPLWAADGACPASSCADKYPGTPEDVGNVGSIFPDPTKGLDYHTYAIEDAVVVPAAIPPGHWVVGFRWDCEQTTQVWTQCADVEIV